MNKSKFEQYTRVSYSGKHLLQKHKLSETGLWQIRGEDPNCDFGGHHCQPDLGTVEGTLQDVIEYAVGLKNFWTWGCGGNIELISVKKIDPVANRRISELRQEAKDLEDRLKEINAELKDLV